jgi:glycosyltransferase involved in cell wall biosynthesis
MNPAAITALILAYNEERNLARTLAPLQGLAEVLVIDSGSTDATKEICAQFANVRVIENPFINFADQANFGLEHVQTPWVLSLDADYRMAEGWQKELAGLPETPNGFRARFVYEVWGQPLRGSLYPPRVVLYQRDQAHYIMDGHTQRVQVSGDLGWLNTSIAHDDRKPLARWFQAQSLYAEAECRKLSQPEIHLGWPDRIRRTIFFAPWLVMLWCLFYKGCWLDGRAGWFYAMQRGLAEGMLSLRLLETKLPGCKKSAHSEATSS